MLTISDPINYGMGTPWQCREPLEGKQPYKPIKYDEDTPDNRTETKDEALASSMLSYIAVDSTAKKEDLEEAFCRDVDSFNLAFQVCLSVIL